MTRILVWEFDVDDDNASKFAAHGISENQLRTVLDRPFRIIRNRAERAADYLLIGRDSSGVCLTIPIAPTSDPTVWRPFTAWRCKASERSKLPRER